MSRHIHAARAGVFRTRIGVGLTVAFCFTACAADGPSFSFNGFGTLGAVRSSERSADFIGNVSQANGAGFTRRWSADVDSKLGLQLNADFTDSLSGVLQIVSEHRYDNTYRPRAEWANLKYRVSPQFEIRAGRTADTLYLQSDLRLVGYAYPWVRRPREIYGLLPVNNKDGIDTTYLVHLGEATNLLQASYGETEFKLSRGRDVTEKRIFTLTDTVEFGAATLRVAYTSLRMTLHTPGLDTYLGNLTQIGKDLSATPGLEATGARAFALERQYRFSDSRYSVVTVGGTYDTGTWLAMAEWARTPTSPAVFPRSNAWYVAGGYRTGRFTPYLTIARLTADRPPPDPGIPLAGLPPLLAERAAELNNSVISVVDGFRFAQKTVSAGVRWDVRKNADVKLQYDRLSVAPGSTGLLGNMQPDFQSGKINVISVAVDFVF